MLTWLGLGAIVVLLVLILRRVTSVLVALTLVPIAAALLGGFGLQIGTFAMDGLRSVLPVAALLAFAVTYFGVMNDAGLFEPLIRAVVRLVGRDPVRIAVGTAALAAATHLDGAGASTFMVTIPAMLPIYARVGMRPVTLSCAAGLAAGTMNMLPWGGPGARAAAALQVTATELFLPSLPAMIAGLCGVFLCAVHLGRRERVRLAAAGAPAVTDAGGGPAAAAAGSERTLRIDARYVANALLTVVALAALFTELLPPAIVFVIALALALLVNHPDPRDQRERLTAHGAAAMLMVTTIFAAGVFTGILHGTGMLASMSADLVGVLPGAVLRHLPVAMGVAAMPLSLVFDPDSFYFGLLPVLASASAAAGGVAIEVGRAAVFGQMTTGFPVSPLTPAAFLLVGLAGVDFADHQRQTIPYALAITLLMTLVALLTGGIHL